MVRSTSRWTSSALGPESCTAGCFFQGLGYPAWVLNSAGACMRARAGSDARWPASSARYTQPLLRMFRCWALAAARNCSASCACTCHDVMWHEGPHRADPGRPAD